MVTFFMKPINYRRSIDEKPETDVSRKVEISRKEELRKILQRSDEKARTLFEKHPERDAPRSSSNEEN